jgi:hypothetical protein
MLAPVNRLKSNLRIFVATRQSRVSSAMPAVFTFYSEQQLERSSLSWARR